MTNEELKKEQATDFYISKEDYESLVVKYPICTFGEETKNEIIRLICFEVEQAKKEAQTQGFNDGYNSFQGDLDWHVGNAVEKEQDRIVEGIRKMKLWSKGTVEGTRNDIINKIITE